MSGVSAMLALSRVVIHAFDLEYCNMLVIQYYLLDHAVLSLIHI